MSLSQVASFVVGTFLKPWAADHHKIVGVSRGWYGKRKTPPAWDNTYHLKLCEYPKLLYAPISVVASLVSTHFYSCSLTISYSIDEAASVQRLQKFVC